MSTGGVIAIVGGVAVLGVGGYLLLRSSAQQQQAALAGAAASTSAAGGASGGGVGGLLKRVVSQWTQDPLGIANTKAAVKGVVGVAGNAAKEVGSTVSSIYHSIAGIF